MPSGSWRTPVPLGQPAATPGKLAVDTRAGPDEARRMAAGTGVQRLIVATRSATSAGVAERWTHRSLALPLVRGGAAVDLWRLHAAPA